jgi:hypothetical protein
MHLSGNIYANMSSMILITAPYTMLKVTSFIDHHPSFITWRTSSHEIIDVHNVVFKSVLSVTEVKYWANFL